MENVDAIVAGAGIWGCTLARRLAESGRKVLVLEKRPVVGGNVRCEIDPETGIEVHTYGSHIFHTHLSEVWQFVNRFVTFNGYQHKVLANCRGRVYHLPLGLTLVNKFFGVELTPPELNDFLDNTPSSKGYEPGADRRQAIFDAFFRGYTSKQWGKAPEEIDPSIIKRVPVRSNYDTNYFNDYNQGIPLTGYNSLFDRLLDHPNISVICKVALTLAGDVFSVTGENAAQVPASLFRQTGLRIFYSGPIDALFGYRFGALPWRTLRFERETLPVVDFQGTSVVNYPDIDVPYTRIHEFKHYHPEARGHLEKTAEGERPAWGFDARATIVMREYSAAWKLGDEPYYPIDNAESRDLLAHYREEADRLGMPAAGRPQLIVGGRLGGYRYYDMDKSIEAALGVKL